MVKYELVRKKKVTASKMIQNIIETFIWRKFMTNFSFIIFDK